MEECYICKAIKKLGRYTYTDCYTTLAVEKGENGRMRIFAWGEGGASISCNYCPNCGRKMEE